MQRVRRGKPQAIAAVFATGAADSARPARFAAAESPARGAGLSGKRKPPGRFAVFRSCEKDGEDRGTLERCPR